jgi:hypothetical protein
MRFQTEALPGSPAICKPSPRACINQGQSYVSDNSPNPEPNPPSRGSTIIAAGLLLAALALVVLYTSQRAFLSPVALVVVAAIGVAALLLQIRLSPGPSSGAPAPSVRGPLWLNALGVLFAVGAVFTDVLHLNGVFMLIAALAAVVSFAISAILVLGVLRKRRI